MDWEQEALDARSEVERLHDEARAYREVIASLSVRLDGATMAVQAAELQTTAVRRELAQVSVHRGVLVREAEAVEQQVGMLGEFLQQTAKMNGLMMAAKIAHLLHIVKTVTANYLGEMAKRQTRIDELTELYDQERARSAENHRLLTLKLADPAEPALPPVMIKPPKYSLAKLARDRWQTSCDSCGSVVTDQSLHTKWHTDQLAAD